MNPWMADVLQLSFEDWLQTNTMAVAASRSPTRSTNQILRAMWVIGPPMEKPYQRGSGAA